MNLNSFFIGFIVNFVIVGVFSVCDTPLKTSTFSFQDECGVIQPDPKDTRTQIPWTAAIFFKTKTSYVYHATGAILSPVTVLTVFAGVHGKLPRKIRGKYSMHNPEWTLVGAGLRSDNLTEADNFTQFAEVSFVEPYMGPEEPNKEYHFVLLHLKTPLDFSTPYVRPICLKYATNTVNSIRKANDTIYLHGGFSRRKIKLANSTEWETELKVQNVTTGTGYECVKNFEHFYERHFPAGMFCAKHPQEKRPKDKSFACLLHGSAIIEKINERWTLSGLTALIRGRKAGMCKHDSVYFNTKIATYLDWIQKSLRCSPFSFSCTDGTCIPLEDVCNSVRNCMDGSDEKEIFCESNNRCESKSRNHHCSLVGKCIAKDELCDGKADCDEGTDESPLLCDKDLSNRNLRDLVPSIAVKTYCLPVPESEGVKIEYSHQNPNIVVNCSMIPVNTVATLSCRNYYKPKFLNSHLELQCNDRGKWSSYSPFICDPDCGMINHIQPSIDKITNHEDIKVHSSNTVLHNLYTIPWYAMIFRQDDTKDFKFVCGASLVEKSYIISGANCVSEKDGSITPAWKLKIIFSPVSKIYMENLIKAGSGMSSPKIINVDNIWRHESYNMRNLSFNIAILKLDHGIQYNAFVRPVCYLPTASPSQDFHFKTRISAKFTGHDSGSLVGLHISDFPKIAEMLCIITSGGSTDKREFTTKCVGQINGTTVHQKDLGGGLFIIGKTNFGSRYIIQGVMNFEERHSAENITFFTTLHNSREWILSIVNKKLYYII